MAVNMLLKFSDASGIKGESKIADHEDEIDVYSWTFGMTQAGTFHSGGGGGGGMVNVQDITCVKDVDASSCDLMQRCCSGLHITDATLTVYKAGGDALDYYAMKMEKIIISSVQTSSSGEQGDAVGETLSLNFAKIGIKYKKQNDDGSGGDEYEMGWNIEKNAAETASW